MKVIIVEDTPEIVGAFTVYQGMRWPDVEVVSATEGANGVWGTDCIEPSTIKMCVRRLRVKLGDNTRDARIIRSHRGVGYSFVRPSASASV